MKYFLLLLTLTSCGMYKQNFDCPSYRGVGCHSVTQIENAIQERGEGEDIFLPTCPQAISQNTHAPSPEHNLSLSSLLTLPPDKTIVNERGEAIFRKPETIRRLWIHGHTNPSGHYIEGHHVYFTIKDESWIVAYPEAH